MKNYEDVPLDFLQREIIKAALGIGAIKINPTEPFTWASGYRMPIYNDNRMLLAYPETRKMVIRGLQCLLSNEGIQPEWIAGTMSAGIPWGESLADKLELPYGYIRDKPKDHGLKNRIEGLPSDKDFQGAKVVVVEDLISTGNSSANAVQAVQDANGNVYSCVSIFNYGFPEAQKLFADLTPPCKVQSLITYPMLLKEAMLAKYLTIDQVRMLKDWSEKPFEWGEKNGFPKIEK
ncbi:MAG: orotate phosphoribosyltransferase [candidate division SR1 bacterium]|nr:orotate phosphoribosyltransferase [candidate division SR1 bacterium]